MALGFNELMDDRTGCLAEMLDVGRRYLKESSPHALLRRVGEVIDEVPVAPCPDKRWFQQSYGREVTDRPDDLLVGEGLFYLTEQRRLFLDCTGGHYQMTWGYDHPELIALLLDGIERGIVWDNHSNIPPAPAKRLTEKLVELANPGRDPDELQDDPDSLNTVLSGTATGTVACGAAMKMMLLHHDGPGAPVFVVLDGNYHGTDVFAQRLRGMWPEYFHNVEIVAVQPNDGAELEAVFADRGERVAGFWAEPVMMNREAIVIEPDYLHLARELCDEHGALMAIDEIQTGFWVPEVIYCVRIGLEPDFIVLGKGMTAGFHPLSALVYRGRLDVLEQYDAISTNGNAALAAYMALGCIELIEQQAERIERAGAAWHQALAELAQQFPETLVEARGVGHMSGLKFRDREDCLGFHRAALDRGLWMRAHVYHEGHSTLLTKFALPLEEDTVEFTANAMRELLRDI
ncbi:MAG: aminotransferase class III-fold pyridoxal phosphate-dependent enzyme [Armatimonadota bacterium]|nr:aminotransferase class III-fold pyridoxal phosphate-dependent enzyme [Armatimonadota bacterium]